MEGLVSGSSGGSRSWLSQKSRWQDPQGQQEQRICQQVNFQVVIASPLCVGPDQASLLSSETDPRGWCSPHNPWEAGEWSRR